MQKKIIYLSVLILFVLFLSICCFNVLTVEAGILDDVVGKLKETLEGTNLSTTLTNMAKKLFFSLALIQIAWSFIQLAAEGKTDMQSVVSTLVRQMIFIGFFYYFLQNGVSIFSSIIESFTEKGQELSGIASVAEIFTLGINTAINVIEIAWEITPWKQIIPVMAIVGFTAIGILLAFTTATLCSVITLCKTYIACTVGVYFLGFGGNSYTKDIAINALKVCYMSGVELFVIFLLAGIGKNLFSNIVTVANMEADGVYSIAFQALVASIVYGGCIKTIPSFISGIVTGASGSAGAGVGVEIAGAVAAAGAAVGSAIAQGMGKPDTKLPDGRGPTLDEPDIPAPENKSGDTGGDRGQNPNNVTPGDAG